MDSEKQVTSWWNKNKKAILLSLGGLFLLAILAIVFLMLSGPLIPGTFCTLVGCVGGLNVEVIGLPDATPFETSITYPSGETQILFCPGETDESIPFEKVCSEKGVFFALPPDVNPPPKITVTITTSAGKWTEVFQPDYQKFQPNGPGCEPTCYNATIVMNISK
jgi:hypothetical protein